MTTPHFGNSFEDPGGEVGTWRRDPEGEWGLTAMDAGQAVVDPAHGRAHRLQKLLSVLVEANRPAIANEELDADFASSWRSARESAEGLMPRASDAVGRCSVSATTRK